MPTESQVAVKIPAEVAARIDRVSKDRQQYVVAAILDALTKGAIAIREKKASVQEEEFLHVSRSWLEDDIAEYAASLPDDDWSDLLAANPGVPVKWVDGVGLVEDPEAT